MANENMRDLPVLFKAFVVPYLACVFGACIGFMFVSGQDIPPALWALFAGALGELGIEVGARKALSLVRGAQPK